MLFDLDDIELPKSDESSENKSSVKVLKFLDSHHQAINNIRELHRLPVFGEAVFLLSLRSFNTFTFIQFIVSECKQIDELYITSYNMARLIIEALMHLVDEELIRYLHVILSDAAKTRFPKTYDLANLEAGKRNNVMVSYKWNHSKIALAKCRDDYYVLEGSGNFSDNSRHEQYLFANNRELYEFRRKWIIDDIK